METEISAAYGPMWLGNDFTFFTFTNTPPKDIYCDLILSLTNSEDWTLCYEGKMAA